jgi:hypothetical protein
VERQISLQLQQQKNLIQNSIIRQSKRLSGAQNHFFEFDNKKNVNIIQRNKKIKIDIEDVDVLENLKSEKLVNKKINNIMKNNNNNNNQNIRVNNFRKVGTNSANKYKINKKNVHNNNNIKKFNNNNSFQVKDDDELSQSSGESEGSDAEEKFFKNRLLIYDDIVITYNRLNHDDEKSLLDKQKSFVEPYPATKQNTFVEPLFSSIQNSLVEPFPTAHANLSNATGGDNLKMNNINETVEVGNNMMTSKKLDEQKRHNAMKKFMANGNNSTSMYWKDDSIDKTYNNNNRPTNIVNSSKKSVISKKITNRSSNINNDLNEKTSNRTNNADQLDNNEEILSGKSNSCLKVLSVNNENKNSVIFNPIGSKRNKLEQQTVTAILNNDDERYQNDNTTNNDMNFNNDSENNVLSRSIINANTKGCSNEFDFLRIWLRTTLMSDSNITILLSIL